jgi:hypothetical protein
MQWSDTTFKPSARTLRQFAGLWIVFFGVLAAWQGLVRGHTAAATVFATLAVTVGPLGWLRPQLIAPIYVGWMVMAFPIGWAVSHLLLALLFYAIFTPLALVFRLLGRDPLQRRRPPDRDSYWTEKPATNDPRRYFKQF